MTGLSLDLAHTRPGFTLAVQADLPKQGLTAVFGPSGAGKSTLLRIVAGLEPGATGRVRFAGEVWQDDARFIPPHRRAIGHVFQEPRLFGHLSVEGNLRYAETRARRAGRTPDFAAVVARIGLGPLLSRRPAGLSGGEAQRVAIGRALLSAPRLMLMDEPLSALDAARREEILPLIETLRDQGGVPILYISHSLAEVARLATTILALDQGRVLRLGPAEAVLSDPDVFPSLAGDETGAVIAARVTGHDPADGLTRLGFSGGHILVPLIATGIGQPVRLRIRARDVMIARTAPQGLSALNILPATVERIGAETAAAHVDLRLVLGEARILARLTRRSVAALGLAPGVACHAILKSVALLQG